MWIEIALFLINQDQSHKWSPAELIASKATCCRKPEGQKGRILNPDLFWRAH